MMMVYRQSTRHTINDTSHSHLNKKITYLLTYLVTESSRHKRAHVTDFKMLSLLKSFMLKDASNANNENNANNGYTCSHRQNQKPLCALYAPEQPARR